ncbi:restriction endonuclease subunit S [Helicobacter cetorum]|uniref:restriction endonuclease subunit S n=1 Tax=Helicobacter cetorum TaxID=138563 RepID=UPI000CF18F9D|nr:restriction endonuclease subunit S [Helicobacter cetorum]
MNALTAFYDCPKEWEVVRLGDICEITTGYSKSKSIDNYGENYIVDMGAISINGDLIAHKRTSLKQDFLSKDDLVMPKDDIGGGNIIGKVAYIDTDYKYILGDHVFKLQIKISKKCDALFLKYRINSNEVNSELRLKACGSAQLGLSKISVTNQLVSLPPLNEQIAIAKILSNLDNEITSLKNKIKTSKNL